MPEYPQIVRVFFCDFFWGRNGHKVRGDTKNLMPEVIILELESLAPYEPSISLSS